MVRDHVPQCAGFFIETAAALDTDGLGNRDLNVVDMVAVPQRLEDAVGETQHQDVLDRFLAEKVIDPIDLSSDSTLRICALRASADAKSCPKGFSTITRRQAFSDCRASPARPSCSIIGPKNRSATAR